MTPEISKNPPDSQANSDRSACVGCGEGPARHGEGYCDRCWHGPQPEWCPCMPELARLRAELERLRQQNHDHAAARDAEMASLRSRVDCYENAHRAARERLEGLRPTWTDAEGTQKPGGWWNYTSLNHRDEAAALFLEVERLRALLADVTQGETAEEGTPQWYALRNARAELSGPTDETGATE